MSAWDAGLLLDIELIVLQGLVMGFLIGVLVIGGFLLLSYALLWVLERIERTMWRVR